MDNYATALRDDEYIAICNECVYNEELFNCFRMSSGYNAIIDGYPDWLGQLYIDYITNIKPYSEISEDVNNWKASNDSIGMPVTYTYTNYGVISPSTIIDIYDYLKIEQLIPDFPNVKNIVEIVGGYGGLCSVISKKVPFDSYTIVDRQCSLNIEQKYLGTLNVENVNFTNNTNISSDIDLVISTFGWNELKTNYLNEIFTNIISKAKHGYFRINNICNDIGMMTSLFESLNSDDVDNPKTINIIPDETARDFLNLRTLMIYW